MRLLNIPKPQEVKDDRPKAMPELWEDNKSEKVE
jgi:hypothetical protein